MGTQKSQEWVARERCGQPLEKEQAGHKRYSIQEELPGCEQSQEPMGWKQDCKGLEGRGQVDIYPGEGKRKKRKWLQRVRRARSGGPGEVGEALDSKQRLV